MFDELLTRLAEKFASLEIPYMVMGGQAVLRHGEPRLTRDIDITLGVGIDQLETVARAAQECGLHPLVEPETFTRDTFVLPLEEHRSGIRVDLVFGLSRSSSLADRGIWTMREVCS